MATKTYSQLQADIKALQDQAAALHAQESEEVIRKMQEAIRVYGITPQDLFGRNVGAKAGRASQKAGSKATMGAKYSDGQGGTWVGRGPRPQWLRDALASGRQLEEFTAGAAAPSGKPAVKKAAPKKGGTPQKPSSASAASKKYQDGQGNAWSGRGPQPQWLKKALAAGQTLADFQA